MPEPETVTQFPHRVREIENLFIPLKDGTRLAARAWLPEDAEVDPVPAILEYLPYRKRDHTADRDALTHPYFAGHGYACLRVDMRGSGDSDGVCRGEYLAQEQDDAFEVLDWLARQPWCTGRAGMIGISWGGFNGLQVAARRHPALQAVITICSTDDRYADDIHFIGGQVLTDKVTWGATAFTIAMTPPDPAIVGHDRWRELWKQRLEGNGLWLSDWLRHQRRDDFYRHGSVCEDWSAMTTPVYAVGGWADGYTNAIFRLMQHLPGPKKALIGPWGHKYPHFARPGPRIGFLQECVRWWDHWLKDRDTGMMDEPQIRAWIEDSRPPSPHHPDVPGRWVAEPAWPAPGIASRTLSLGAAGLREASQDDPSLTIASPQTTGRAAGAFYEMNNPDGPLDQREEAGGSLIFDTEPLAGAVDLLGFPELHLALSSDRPEAMLAATLSEVLPDGRARRFSYGVLNLSHRHGHAEPQPMTPGAAETVTLRLNACGTRLAPGTRLRLALSTAYWPLVFPAPEPVTLTIRPGATLTLPVRSERGEEALPPFGPPEAAPPMQTETLRAGRYARQLDRNLVSGVERIERIDDAGEVRHLHTGIAYQTRSTERFTIHPDDPASATVEAEWVKAYRRGDWNASVETRVGVRALAGRWHLTAQLIARDGDDVLHEARWDEDIPRDHV